MNLLSKISLTAFGAIAIYTSLLFSHIIWKDWGLKTIVNPKIVFLIPACAFGFYIWKNLKAGAKSLSAYTLLGAVILGSTGFILGFIGPIILHMGNQGPLLGIFLTGPIGFMLGAVAGSIYWKRKVHVDNKYNRT